MYLKALHYLLGKFKTVGLLVNSPVLIAVHLSARSLPWTQPCVVLNGQSMSAFSVPLHAALAMMGPSPCPASVALAGAALLGAGSNNRAS